MSLEQRRRIIERREKELPADKAELLRKAECGELAFVHASNEIRMIHEQFMTEKELLLSLEKTAGVGQPVI